MTFERFAVVGGNRIAHAAALKTTHSPTPFYNPLFIHGSVGVGTTHLLQAVCHDLSSRNPKMKICFTTADRLIFDELPQALKNNTLRKLQEKYRRLDMLALDTISIVSGQIKFQEEILDILNTLLNNNKHVLIGSSSAPDELKDFSPTLISRLSDGLVVQIDPPNPAECVTILTHMLKARKQKVHPVLIEHIANHYGGNIRILDLALLTIQELEYLCGPLKASQLERALAKRLAS